MSGRRITQVQLHEGQDTVRIVVHEWPDPNRDMDAPVVLGSRTAEMTYDVEVLVPSGEGRFDFDPFHEAVQHVDQYAASAIIGDPVEQRRRTARGSGPVGPFYPI